MKKSQFFSIIIVLIILFIAGCQPPPTSTDQKPPTSPPPKEGIVDFTPGSKVIAFVLPGFLLPDSNSSGVILRVIPPLEPPTSNMDELISNGDGIIVGDLEAVRDLPLSDTQYSFLPSGNYLVKVKQEMIIFIDNNGNELVTSLKADLRSLNRSVSPPEVIITIKDICYSWLQVQVCTEPVPNMALTQEERDRMWNTMFEAVVKLDSVGRLNMADINVAGTIPDMVGNTAIGMQQASILAAPTVNFPSPSGEEPTDGALLGVVIVNLPIDKPNYPLLSEGIYAVYAVNKGQNEWEGRFVNVDGVETLVPSKFVEVRGDIEEPMAIVLDLRICLCFFQC